MITTEGGETKVGEAVRLGAAGYVRKPFTADQIKEKLVGILRAGANVMNLHDTYCRIPSSDRPGDVFSTMLGVELSGGEVTVETDCFRTQRRRRLVYWHRRKLGRYRKHDLLAGAGLPHLSAMLMTEARGR